MLHGSSWQMEGCHDKESQSNFRAVRVTPRRAIEQALAPCPGTESDAVSSRSGAVSSRLGMESDLESAVVARQAGFVRLRARLDEFCRWSCCRCCWAVLWQRGEKDDRQLVPTPCLAGPSGRPGKLFRRAAQGDLGRSCRGAAKL